MKTKTKQEKKQDILKAIQALSTLAIELGAEQGHWIMIDLRSLYKKVSDLM